MHAPAHTRVPNERLFLVVLAVLSGLTPLSIDMYLPAFPAMGRSLGVSAGEIQLTLSTYLVGFAAGMLAWGPVGDRFGRRAPMMAGLLVYAVASALIALAGRIEQVIALRALQALGGCAVGALANAAVADVFDRERSARAFSLINTVFLGAPLVAPTLGSVLMGFGGWRLLFWVLAGFGLLSIAGLLLLPETLPPARRRPISVGAVISGYAGILKDGRYLAYVAVTSLLYGGMFAYLAASPFVYMSHFGLSAGVYGVLFGVNVLAMMGVSYLNSRLVVTRGSDRLLRLGVTVAAGAAVALLASAWTGLGGLLGVALPLFAYLAMLGFVGSNAGAGALAAHRETAGAASALMGACSMGTGAIVSAVTGALADGTPRPMASLMAGAAVTGLLILLLVLRRPASD